MTAHTRSGTCLAPLLLAILTGCAGQPDRSLGPLDSIEQQQAKRLAAECFASNEGWRFLHGDPVIWVACQNWATDQIR